MGEQGSSDTWTLRKDNGSGGKEGSGLFATAVGVQVPPRPGIFYFTMKCGEPHVHRREEGGWFEAHVGDMMNTGTVLCMEK